MNKELGDLTDERDKMKKRVEELEYVACPAEDKIEEEKDYSTRAEMIVNIRELEQDFMDTLDIGFKAVIEQLKLDNPEVELVTKGINP